MLEIILGVITALLTVISGITGALAVKKSKCKSGCCDIALQTSPEQEDVD